MKAISGGNPVELDFFCSTGAALSTVDADLRAIHLSMSSGNISDSLKPRIADPV
ncbi:hypothetical protein [Pseudanabaena sp. SR411]|uniref:hypothetical protein n=1 Tax=Pseudanabaena sp. SR411 TaxID=1980935 RepID=UPI0020CE09EB|nr:hypothetical protein [Pseudanabaena sp. SR411]